MNKIIYAVKIADLSYSGLKIVNVKIGQAMDMNSTLRQYKRSNPNAEILDLWELNPSFRNNPYECEGGIQKVAEKYAYERRRETFIFLQESYQKFARNIDLILKNITKKIFEKKNVKQMKRKNVIDKDYTKTKPKLLIFHGKTLKVNTWRGVLCRIAEEIYKEQKDFTPVLRIRGRKRIYFSKDSRDLTDSQVVQGSPYFCEGNLNANSIIKIVRTILDNFGYDQKDLKIITK